MISGTEILPSVLYQVFTSLSIPIIARLAILVSSHEKNFLVIHPGIASEVGPNYTPQELSKSLLRSKPNFCPRSFFNEFF